MAVFIICLNCICTQLFLVPYFVAGGDGCPGTSTIAKGPRSPPVSFPTEGFYTPSFLRHKGAVSLLLKLPLDRGHGPSSPLKCRHTSLTRNDLQGAGAPSAGVEWIP